MKFRYQKFILGFHDPTRPLIARPFIPVYLYSKNKKTQEPFYALLDSGADRVILPADLAEAVGITKIETGRPEPTLGVANQRTDVYFHPLSLQVVGDTSILPTEVGFSRDIPIPLLGRTFFQHFKSITFVETKEEVELK